MMTFLSNIHKKNNSFHGLKKQQGYSWLSIFLVIIAIASIVAFFTARVVIRSEQERITLAKEQIAILQTALDKYKKDNGNYPSQLQGLEALVTLPRIPPIPRNWPVQEGYLSRLPLDPWGQPYQYLNPGIQNPNSIDIFSLGPPKNRANGKKNKIGNW